MAYVNTFYVNDVQVTCTGGGAHTWIHADFKIVAKANSNSSAYTVQIYARIDAGNWMEWDGTSVLRVKCNGLVASASMKLAMYNSTEGAITDWDGPATFTFGGTDSVNLTFEYIQIDLTSTTGTNGLPGIWHVDHGNMTDFTARNYKITIGDGGLEPLLQPPVVSDLINDKPFGTTNTAVSEYTDRISLSWTADKTITESYYRIDSGTWNKISTTVTKHLITGLTAGTNYNIDVYSKNGAGDSNILSTTIRTRHLQPVVTLTFDNRTINAMTYKWTSDKSLATTEYKLGTNGAWINTNTTGLSGSFTIGGLNPDTKYTVFFRGTSASENDSLLSEEIYYTETTYDAPSLSSGDLIFGEDIIVNIDNPANATTELTITASGNSRTATITTAVVPGRNVITCTQDQLDNIYRCYSNTNYIDINMLITTTIENKPTPTQPNVTYTTYTDEQDYTMQLTGIAKTVHFNPTGTTDKRAMVFFGVNSKPRRVVFWVGDNNNKPRRCI